MSPWNKWIRWFVRPKKAYIEYIYCSLSNVQSHHTSVNKVKIQMFAFEIDLLHFVCERKTSICLKCLGISFSNYLYLFTIYTVETEKKYILINQHILIQFLTFLFIDLHRSNIEWEKKKKKTAQNELYQVNKRY